MAYTTENFRTKKALKEAVKQGKYVGVFNPGPVPCSQNGTVFLEGPHFPAAHTWYAQATVENGRVIKVK